MLNDKRKIFSQLQCQKHDYPETTLSHISTLIMNNHVQICVCFSYCNSFSVCLSFPVPYVLVSVLRFSVSFNLYYVGLFFPLFLSACLSVMPLHVLFFSVICAYQNTCRNIMRQFIFKHVDKVLLMGFVVI